MDGSLWLQGQPGLQCEFQVSPGYMQRPPLKEDLKIQEGLEEQGVESGVGSANEVTGQTCSKYIIYMCANIKLKLI